MADPRYKDVGDIADRVIEECSELIKEICKAKRFGYTNFHPDAPRKPNYKRIEDEIQDVRRVLTQYCHFLEEKFY